ncbi:MAG TPA: hypothetical protein VFP34_17950 [Microlunatus sp.]|nr:hypothetical protein [Microlunatus sp.]
MARTGSVLATSRADDRVLPFTKALSAVIVPFLVLAFVVLYVFPGQTARLFAWPIASTMTSMTLASAYLGGVYFFLRVLRLRRWHMASTGFVAVALFASLLGVATILHWPVFSHDTVAFWLWAALYWSTPFLVVGAWLANRRYAAPPEDDEPRLSRGAARVVGVVGLLALVQGVTLFVAPTLMIPYWPWPLTPLTAQVIGAIFCLGCAGLVSLRDNRWSTIELLVQVAMVMIVSIMVAAIRAAGEFDPRRVLTWLLLAGFVLVLLGCLWLWLTMTRRRRVPA